MGLSFFINRLTFYQLVEKIDKRKHRLMSNILRERERERER